MKKRTVGTLAAVAALGIAVYVGSRLGAQPIQLPPPPGGAATLRTKICVVNMSEVISKYKKFVNYQNDLKSQRLQAQGTIDQKRKLMADAQAEIAKPETSAARKEQLTHWIKTAERELNDYMEEYKEKNAKAQGDFLVQVYREVQDVVRRYAVSRDVDLVLQYSDAPTAADFYNPVLIERKLMNQAVQPMVMAAGMDITNDVLALLNQQYGAAPAPNTTH